MSASVYYESASEFATLINTFLVDNVATDPSDVTLLVKSPSGAEDTYTYSLSEITKESTGKYSKSVACTEAGEWEYVWTGTVTAADVASGTFTVFPLNLGKLYATVDGLKDRMGINSATTEDEYELHLACIAASRGIEHFCGRVFYRSPDATVRTFVSKDLYCLKLPAFNDVVSIASLKTDATGDGVFEETWASSDYQLLWGENPNLMSFPEPHPADRIEAVATKSFPCEYTRGTRRDRVQITGVFGWPSVPWDIKEAALILAQDLFTLKDGSRHSLGYNEFGRMRAKQNPHVVTMCSPYRRAELIFPLRTG